MSLLLTNSFEMPADNWYQISALGEFQHNPTGLIQIIDEDCCRAMVERFNTDAAAPNHPGILIDFDHFSLDQGKPSEAAGWIVKLEQRPTGLWAQIRWTDKGEESVRGGRYRFISPVFRQDECLALGNNRVKPQRLVNAAVTNDPNISGMVPLSNSSQSAAPAEPVRLAPGGPQVRSDRRQAGLIVEQPPTFTPPHGCDYEREPVRVTGNWALFNRAVQLIANGGPGIEQMTEEQRKAMFAHIHGGGGGGGGGCGGSGEGGGSGGGMGRAASASPPAGPSTPDPSQYQYSPTGAEPDPYRPDYTSSRDFDARIALLEDQRAAVASMEPQPPEPKTFDQINIRELEQQLMRSGVSFIEIRNQLQAAQEHNRAVQRELNDIKDGIKAKFKDQAKQKAALQAYFDKVEMQNAKAMADYEKERAKWEMRLQTIDYKIELEHIRQEEAVAATGSLSKILCQEVVGG